MIKLREFLSLQTHLQEKSALSSEITGPKNMHIFKDFDIHYHKSLSRKIFPIYIALSETEMINIRKPSPETISIFSLSLTVW